MTSEDIIQRLLDEKKITVKEAMVILKDLAKIGINEIKRKIQPNKILPNVPNVPTNPWEDPNKWPYGITVMYGVTTNPYTFSENESITSARPFVFDKDGNMIFKDEEKNNIKG